VTLSMRIAHDDGVAIENSHAAAGECICMQPLRNDREEKR